MKLSFGEPAQNDQIVRDAKSRLDEMVSAGELAGGSIIKLNGPASLPVAHLYEVVAVYDPKMGKYVVAVSHGVAHQPGDLID